jgi:hypothetical protein
MNSFESSTHDIASDLSLPHVESLESREPSPNDWDESIRTAFVYDCMHAGIRAGLLLEAVQHARHPEVRRLLETGLNDAAHRASKGWEAIDRCLIEWGELSASALERAIEEASLELRQDGGRGGARERFGRAIVERARARLARFRSIVPCAA